MREKAKIEKKSFFLNFLKQLILFFLFIFMVVFLGTNIYFSQNISPLFLKVINPDYQSAIAFLKKIKKTPYFSQELSKFKKIYGEKIVEEVFRDEIELDKKIKKYESLLKINSNNPDLLYNLYLLYKKKGNEKLAQEYLKKAREIDPWIKE